MRDVTVFEFFAYPGQNNDGQCPTEPTANTKYDAFDKHVFALLHEQGSTKDRTIYRNQWQENSERVVESWKELIEEHLQDLYHRRNYADKTNQTQKLQIIFGQEYRALLEEQIQNQLIS